MPIASGFKIDGDARKMVIIKVSGKQYLVVAVNDGNLQLFQIY
jgi:hypothetical protein